MKQKITEATIYRGGASVTREVEVAGEETVSIGGLPFDVTEGDISVYAAGGDVVDVKLVREEGAALRNEKLTALKQAWDAAAAAVFRNEMALEFYKQNLKVEGGTAAVEKAFPFFDAKISQLAFAAAELRAAEAEAKRAYDELAAALPDTHSARAIVRLRGEVQKLVVTTLTRSAGWTPVYEAHTDGKTDVLWQLKACAFNNSGEDWENVPVTFSTAQILREVRLPVFRPDYIGRPVNERIGLRAAPRVMSCELTEDAAEAYAAPIETESEADVTYRLASATVLSGDTASYTLKEERIGAKFGYYAPSFAGEDVFYIAELDKALERGRIKVYNGGRYLGETEAYDRASAELGLGRADRIRIKREKGKQFTSQKLIKGTKTDYSYTVTVCNDRRESVEVRLVDSVPVSTNKAVTLDITDTKGAAYDAEKGMLTWNLTVKGGETASIEVRYTVTNNQ